MVRDLVRTILTGQGYEVLVALDPQHAETLASDFPGEIHLLLTDVVMPGTSGRELAARIFAARPGIRVLYMSGYTENVITSGGLLEHGLAFLQKPFSPAALVRKIREVLSRAIPGNGINEKATRNGWLFRTSAKSKLLLTKFQQRQAEQTSAE